MITHSFHKILWLLILSFSLMLPNSARAAAEVVKAAENEKNITYCPPLNALKKDPETLTWSASGGWKSFELSFVEKITRFSGAQWRGTNVGQIFCVYRDDSPTSFPILLVFNTLTLEPQGGKWSGNLGGYLNCQTSVREECPFAIRIKNEEEDLYEQAKKLKHPSPSTTTPGF